VSWETASFLILGAVLLGGFAWYERSRPPSQVVALVAALAALAIAGRIAFAAFPNVKPTTDIVVFAGYALGPAPGFAVGALTGLVSNFWFGQGPWTPWQMVGWGLCGVLGAALALGGRNAGRLTLAAACGLAGIGYGVLLNFSLMATYGGDLSLERFLALEARAIPFDAAHAIGNVVLALIAGPAMVRMLIRFRERFEWRVPAVVTAMLVALALPALAPVPAEAAETDRAVSWLESTQNADGGFGASPGQDSSAAITGWAMLGLEAAGRHPLDVARLGGQTPVDFLRASVDEVSSTGDIARTIVALEGAGVNPRSFGGRNLVSELLKRRRDDGSFEGWPGTTSFAAIALRSAGATGGLDRTLTWLREAQNEDGGWGDVLAAPSNADVTSAAMQALAGSKAADRGLAYLRKTQRPGGGFALGGSGGVNSQSTAWAIQGMLAAGAGPASIRAGGKSALDYLDARQAADGRYSYSASSDQTPVWVTGQALVAVAGETFPVPVPKREPEGSPKVEGGTAVTPGSTAAPDPGSPPAPPPPSAGGVGAPPEPSTPPGPPALEAPESPPSTAGPEGEGPTPASPPPDESRAAIATAGDEDSSSPLAPLGVGLASGGLALGGVVLLGRRFGW
jgi:Prenyltransferase and squalene oxidase repeat